MAKTVTTTIGLPITAKPEDQRLYRMINRNMARRGFRARTTYLRLLIKEDADRLGVK